MKQMMQWCVYGAVAIMVTVLAFVLYTSWTQGNIHVNTVREVIALRDSLIHVQQRKITLLEKLVDVQQQKITVLEHQVRYFQSVGNVDSSRGKSMP